MVDDSAGLGADSTPSHPAGRSLSQPVSPLRVLRVTTVKELQLTRRYLPNLLGRFVELSIRMAFFFLLSNIVSVNASSSPLGEVLTGRDLVIFFQGALLLFVFNATALSSPVESVQNDLLNGTLEYLFSCSSSRYAYFVGTVIASALVNLVIFLPLYAFMVIYAGASWINTLLILLTCLTVLITVVALGVLIGVLAILWRQVGSIAQVLAILFEMLAGAYFPVAAFPEALRFLAYLLPYTWGYDLIRFYSFDGRWKTLLPVWMEWGLLLVYAALFTVLSRWVLQRAETRAKRQGLHLI